MCTPMAAFSSSSPPGYLRGVDVVAETSFVVTSQSLTYEWRGYGVKLHVRQDSLPADCPQCRMEMRASLSGQYALPADCELVSGVYWVYCPVKLSKRATLEVQHCSTKRDGLSFVRAECTQEQLPYVFRKQEGGVFSDHSSYGSIELSRFSGWGIMLKSLFRQPSDSIQYTAQVYYANSIRNIWTVLFMIRCRKDLDLEDTVGVGIGVFVVDTMCIYFLQCMQEFHRRLEAVTGQKIIKFGMIFPVGFTADRIELQLPNPPSGWSLTCLSLPVVSAPLILL